MDAAPRTSADEQQERALVDLFAPGSALPAAGAILRRNFAADAAEAARMLSARLLVAEAALEFPGGEAGGRQSQSVRPAGPCSVNSLSEAACGDERWDTDRLEYPDAAR